MARQRTPEGPPPPPPVQKLRLRYAKRGRLRFSSTRDFQRALERALRRADVPMAYSAGFHPHPKISYTNAAPTGTASEAEFFEISVIERLDPQAVRAALDAALPEGLDVLAAVEAPPGSLADRLQAGDWVLELRDATPELAAAWEAAWDAFRGHDHIEVTRMTKSGERRFDVRAAVVRVQRSPEHEADGAYAVRMILRHTTPAVRPDDVLRGLRGIAPDLPAADPVATRLLQGPLTEDGQVTDPLAD